jgi:uncharacterized protein with HEPN domain
MSPSPREYLQHIQQELEYLHGTSVEISKDAFSQDPTYQRAFARSLEIIGEATKKLDREFTDAHPGIPWSDMAKLRDKLIHHYFGIDYELVWSIVDEEIPDLKPKITQLLELLDSEN